MESIEQTLSDTLGDTFTDSDVENPLSKQNASDEKTQTLTDQVDYWYGSIFLKSVVAQKLLTQPNSKASVPELDVRSFQNADDHDYGDHHLRCTDKAQF